MYFKKRSGHMHNLEGVDWITCINFVYLCKPRVDLKNSCKQLFVQWKSFAVCIGELV